MKSRDAAPAGLLLVILAYAGLSVLYHAATPPQEASDESGHVAHVLCWKDERRMPVARAGDESPMATQEYAQPPLYYAAASLLVGGIDTSDHLEYFRRRPGAPIGRADLPGPKNMFLPGPDRSLPGRRTLLAITVMRAFSCLLGAGSIAVAWQLARRLGATAWTSAVAAGLVAFNPMFLFIGNSVNNDNLVILLTGVALLAILRGVDRGFPDVDAAVAGAAIGAAVLAKASALILLPVLGLAALAGAPSWFRWIRTLAISIAVAACISGWWFGWNLHHYGQWLPVDIQAAFAWNARPGRDWFALFREWGGFQKSFWGVFGAFNVIYPGWVYALFGVLTVAGAAAVVRAWFAGGFEPRGTAVLLAALVGANLAAVALWTSWVMGSQGRLMFPSLPAIAALTAVGIQGLGRIGRVAGATVCGVLVLLAGYGALVVIPAQYLP